MIIVLDTCSLYGDLRFMGLDSRILVSHSGAESYRLVIPAPVVMEHKKKLQEQLQQEYSRMTTAAEKVTELGIEFKPLSLNVELSAEKIHEATMKHLKEAGAEFPEMPQPDHALFAERSVSETKPFGPKSRGYRDALIWETVRELAKEDEVILVTVNKSDFNAPGDDTDTPALHADLLKDLKKHGIAETQVRVFRTLSRVVSEVVALQDQIFGRILLKLEEDKDFADQVAGALIDALFESHLEITDSVTVADFGPFYGNVEIVDGDIGKIRLLSAYDLAETGDEGVVLTFSADAFARFSFAESAGAGPYLQVERGIDVDVVGAWALAETDWRPITFVAQVLYDPEEDSFTYWRKASISDRRLAENSPQPSPHI